jgi:FkbM family methyltransferase
MHELMLLRDLAGALRSQKADLSFYDIGANVGQHSLFMCQHVSWVVSFEPFRKARAMLERKIEENSITNISLFSLGLGARDEALPFAEPTTENMGTGTFRVGRQIGPITSLVVRRGDAVLAEHGLPKIDILKIDVEGFEAFVFEGLNGRLSRDRPVILTEISGADRSGFRSLAGFSERCYSDCDLYSVGSTSISGTYRISPALFSANDEILVVPKEHRRTLGGIVGHL